MSEKKNKGITPTSLRLILSITIVLMVAVSAVGFWFFRNALASYAADVDKAAKEATASSSDIANLQQLQKQLEQDSVAVNRAKNIVADSKSYQYQNQIISDLNTYAKASGVTISGYNFTTDTPTSGGSAAATPASPQPLTPAGLKSTSVSVTVKTPVDYKAIMKFIHSIEINLTKMQLTGISLTRAADNGNQVTTNPLTIEVYIR